MAYPDLTAEYLVSRVRGYLNEATASFYTSDNLYDWLSAGARDIARSALCVRRIIDAQTTSGNRYINNSSTTEYYKPIHVEYIPSSGREVALTKITPLQIGHFPMSGTAPQYWIDHGADGILIDPVPDDTYDLRIYIADSPKLEVLSFTSFTEGVGAEEWDADEGWTCGTTAAHAGTMDSLTYNTALTASKNHTIIFTVSGVDSGTVTPYIGANGSCAISTNGVHTVNITSPAANTDLIFTATGTIVIENVYVLEEADFSATTDQTELTAMWLHLMVMYATYHGLLKDRKLDAAAMVESIYRNEIAYIRDNIIEVIPDGRVDLKYL